MPDNATYDAELGVHVHRSAAAFALLDGTDYQALLENIRVRGQREPITMWNGVLLDGRNRIRACRELGIEPDYIEWEPQSGDSPEAFILSKNVMRRHLTKSQRAAHAAELYLGYVNASDSPSQEPHPDPVRDPFGQVAANLVIPTANQASVRDAVAQMVGVSSPYIGDAYSLLRADKPIFEAVKGGQYSLKEGIRRHCRAHHEAGTLLSESTLRSGLKRQFLTELEQARDQHKPKQEKRGRRRRAAVHDIRERLSPQQIAGILRRQRNRSGIKSSIVPTTFELTFANDAVREEYERRVLQDDRVLRAHVTVHDHASISDPDLRDTVRDGA